MKTTRHDGDVDAFLEGVTNERRRNDCRTVVDLMREITGHDPALWGPSIIGFGSYHYVYASGREGDWFTCGFSPRKQALTIYVMAGFSQYDELMAKLGKYKTGKACLYVKSLDDIDRKVLKKLLTESVRHMKKKNK